MTKKRDITLLFPPKTSAYQYSLYPLLMSRAASRIRFTQDYKRVLSKDTNDILMLFSWLKHRKEHKTDEWLSRLRDKYKVLVYFDGEDSSSIPYLDVLPYFDLYYKKQALRDRSLYLRQFSGNRIFAQYYSQLHNLEEDDPAPLYPPLEDIAMAKRIRIGWNIAIGKYPLSRETVPLYHLAYLLGGATGLRWMQAGIPRRAAPARPAKAKCHARFGYSRYRGAIGYQRRLFLELVRESDVFLSGLVPKNQYNKEIKEVQAVLSPFGWGEVCYRDAEAVINGAVLVKPDMSHLETWPDLYQENETYLPVNWDGSDLVEQVGALFEDGPFMEHLRISAWNTLKSSYETCAARADDMIAEIRDLR